MIFGDDLAVSQNRKREHIKYFLNSKSNNNNQFDKIILQNNSLPEIDFSQIDTKVNFLGKTLNFPLVINAITGGFDEAIDINKQLGLLAKKYNIAIAVGSQSIAIKNDRCDDSYKIVREVCKNGVVLSNLGANCKLENAQKAVDMLDADGIQLHLNCAQEIFMYEGDRNFKGILKNIENIVHKLGKPVIVKEVGFGISKSVAEKLYNVGVKYIDIGGKGGTNFIEIENLRTNTDKYEEFYDWGISTAQSLCQCVGVNENLNIICSGGITRADEIVKSLCVGAKIVGISGIILKKLLLDGYKEAQKYLSDLVEKTKIMMLLVGAENVDELKNIPYKLNF